MTGFSVTYEIITPESAEHGDAAERGFLAQDVTLREALEAMDASGVHVEADCYPVQAPRWLTAYGVSENYRTGGTENRSLHLPESLSESSRLRIARLLGCYGA